MSTKSPHRKPGARPRIFRVLALVASLSIAMAGLIGLGLAPAASAATCPDGYTLNGNVCEKTETTNAVPTSTTAYYCPEGFLPSGQVSADTVCTREVPKVQDYKCPDGYSTSDNPITKDSVCTKEETKTTKPDKSKVCLDVSDSSVTSSSRSDGKDEEGCSDWEWVYTCPAGYEPAGNVDKDTTCTKTETKEKSSVPDGKPYCPTSVSSSSSSKHGGDDDDEGDGGGGNGGGGTCTETAPPVEMTTTTWACPTDGVPAWTPDTVWNQEPTQPACSRTVTTSMIPDTPPGTTTTPDCNLTGSCGLTCEQLGNCVTNTSVPPPVVDGGTVVTPEEGTTTPVVNPEPGTVPAAKPKPAKVGVPEAATVPAAVPAGGGSQAPALPIWALALVAAGIIGAASAGKHLVGARK